MPWLIIKKLSQLIFFFATPCSKYDFSILPPEDDEDYIDMGAARLQFYSSLVDLLGHCAPDAETIKAGRSDSIRARAILRSLVSMEDLEGVLGLRFILPIGKPEQVGCPKVQVQLLDWCYALNVFCIVNKSDPA